MKLPRMKLLDRLRAHARRLHAEQESGVALTEFAIAFPAQLFLTLGIMQLSLIIIGTVLTEQASFAAARAAIVADVPKDGATGTVNQTTIDAQVQAQAQKAAAYVLMPLCPTNAEYTSLGGTKTAPVDAIHFAKNDSSNAAYDLTKVTLTRTNPGDRYVGVEVDFDMPLIIPVVNHWFAKIGNGGTPGEFWYGPNNGKMGYNSESQKRKITCLTISYGAVLPRPWSSQ